MLNYDDLHKLLQEPEWKWKVPTLHAMTDKTLIQEMERRGYIVKQSDQKSDKAELKK